MEDPTLQSTLADAHKTNKVSIFRGQPEQNLSDALGSFHSRELVWSCRFLSDQF